MRVSRFRILFLAALFGALLHGTALASDDLTKPIRSSPDGHFLAQADGKPFFWLADIAWTLFARLTREEADAYLKDRADKGFTVIQAVVLGGPWYGLDEPNRYGQTPLVTQKPLRPNEKYFEHVDWVVDRAASYGLRIAMLPVWSINEISRAKKRVIDESTALTYGRWLAHRYQKKGIIWMLGGDTNPIWLDEFSKREFPSVIDYRPIYDALAKGISEGAGEKPFITYHPTGLKYSGTSEPRTSLYFHERIWLDMNMIQSSHFTAASQFMKTLHADFAWDGTQNYQIILDEYRSVPTRPVVDGEPRFEDLNIDLDEHAALGYWKGYDTRNAAYHAVFAGAAGHSYGHHSVWQFVGAAPHSYQLAEKSRPWREAIQAESSSQMQHLKRLMLSRPYFVRIPDQSFLTSHAEEGSAHIGATRSRDGSYAMVYSPQGAPFSVALSHMSGQNAIGWWFDPRTGSSTRISGTFPTTGASTFTPPTRGSESDWVLVLDDENKGFTAPGKIH